MSTDDTTPVSDCPEWDFPTLAYIWDPGIEAIMVGADTLESLSEEQRARSLTALSRRVDALARGFDDGWLVSAAYFMIDDLYKSAFLLVRWSPGIHGYIAATAGTVMQVLAHRGFVLHYVVDNTQSETVLAQSLAGLPSVFEAAGLLVTGPQLMAQDLMERDGHDRSDVAALLRYRTAGHTLADQLIRRCHQQRRPSVYVNLDLDDDTPGLSMDVALSQSNTPGTIVVFRNLVPIAGTFAHIAVPPGVTLPTSASSAEEFGDRSGDSEGA